MLLFTDFLWFPVTLLAIFIFARVFRKQSETRRYPPSLPSLPLVGSLPFMLNVDNIHEFFMSKVDQLGPIYTFREGRNLCLTLNSREAIEDALVNNSACFSGRATFYMELVSNKNGKGIVGKAFDDDFKTYHMLSLTVLKEFGFGINSLIEARISEEFESMEHFIRTKEGQEFDPSKMARLCTYNVIKNILFAKREDYEKGPDEILINFMAWVRSITFAIDVAPDLLKLVPYFSRRLKLSLTAMSSMCHKLDQEIESIKTNGTAECFISSYLAKEGPDYDHEQLIYTARDLIGAGSETTATALLWLLVFIANNRSIQERLQKEIDEVIPKHRLPSLDDQPKLPFVEATILEVLRFRTILPIATPHLTLSDSEVCGYFIPAGTKVFPNLHAAHMDPKVWTHPDVFNPDRFLDKDNNIVGRERVITFSLGRRSCLGEILARQELFLFLTGWIQRFNIQSGEDGQKVDETPVVEATMMPLPFKIRMMPREV